MAHPLALLLCLRKAFHVQRGNTMRAGWVCINIKEQFILLKLYSKFTKSIWTPKRNTNSFTLATKMFQMKSNFYAYLIAQPLNMSINVAAVFIVQRLMELKPMISKCFPTLRTSIKFLSCMDPYVSTPRRCKASLPHGSEGES